MGISDGAARATGLPLFPVELPQPCPNDMYEKVLHHSLESIYKDIEFDALAFGDVFLEEIRTYREQQLSAWGFEPLFPIWKQETTEPSRTVITAGVRAIFTCVDPKQCPAEFIGRRFDQSLLAALPSSVDPCGENGKSHTFVYDAPVFDAAISITVQRGHSKELVSCSPTS